MSTELGEMVIRMEGRVANLEGEWERERVRAESRDRDVEERLRKVERAIYLGLGALGLMQLVLKYAH